MIEGIGPGLIPQNLDTSVIDEVLTVSSEEAMENARRLAVEEGVLAGISSGAALSASLKVTDYLISPWCYILTLHHSFLYVHLSA